TLLLRKLTVRLLWLSLWNRCSLSKGRRAEVRIFITALRGGRRRGGALRDAVANSSCARRERRSINTSRRDRQHQGLVSRLQLRRQLRRTVSQRRRWGVHAQQRRPLDDHEERFVAAEPEASCRQPSGLPGTVRTQPVRPHQ